MTRRPRPSSRSRASAVTAARPVSAALARGHQVLLTALAEGHVLTKSVALGH
ncbi:MAG TPA: hypothetical protein VGY50_00555 [Streptosporangiaceae bacterium]|nr:hypothetical protein [Streptosporangiaceae bacterium]